MLNARHLVGASARSNIGPVAIVVALATLSVSASTARAVQFNYLDPNYTQEIYTGPLVGGPGMAWTPSNHLLTRNGQYILEYSPTQNGVHQGTNVHNVTTTHTIPGLLSTGFGITNGLDGNIYTVTSAGLQRFSNTLAGPATLLPGTVGGQGYGINTLIDGRIVYSDGSGSSNVYLFNPASNSNTLIYSGGFTVDDIETGPGGQIALAGQSNSSIVILNSSGTVLNSFSTNHFPDGLAFGDGPFPNSLYSNNNDGSITRYDLGPGYAGTPTQVDIATSLPNGKAYGDLAAVGPDCAFYVSVFDNGGYHGSTPGVGTHWDNGTTNSEPSIVRIALGSRNGLPADCGFFSLLETTAPEPTTLVTAMAGGVLVGRRARRPVLPA